MEGSYTWFGLTDFKGRPKPSYYALKELWTKEAGQTLPDVFIDAPKTITPGMDYVYAARSSKSLDKNYTYEWYLLKDEFLERVDNIESNDDGRSITLHIPQEHSDYRLYLYVSDQSGNVTTASVPVKVL
jgi:hypothetical protein